MNVVPVDCDVVVTVRTGLLAKYRAEVTSASEGAVTVVPDWD